MDVATLRRLPQNKAKVILRAIVKDTSRLQITKHASERMVERGVNTQQVLKVLERGSFIEDPYWSPTKASHQFTLRYYYAGVRLEVAAAITGYMETPDHEKVIVITVIDLK